jgi:hypothetical protein
MHVTVEPAEPETSLTGWCTLTGVRACVFLAVILLVGGCSTPSEEAQDKVGFSRIELGGAVPVRVAADGGDLLVAVRQDDKDDRPGLLSHAADGTNTDIPLTSATEYGAEALWYSLTAAGGHILAVGGKRGGAHGNVRWSVWDGDRTGITERAQTFSTFGGLGAGELVDGVLPSTGPLVVGTWQSASAGSDAAVWTFDGTTWTRGSSAGTALESTAEELKFPMSATTHGDDVLIAGWELADAHQQPIVWTLRAGVATVTTLPDAGRSATAIAVSCTPDCAVTGRVDGQLAVWRQRGTEWTRVPGLPKVPVSDTDRPVAPVGDTLVYADRGVVRLATLGVDSTDISDAAGPTGVVTAVARVDDSTYVLAGPTTDEQSLWRAD